MLRNTVSKRLARVRASWFIPSCAFSCGIALLGAGLLLLTACDASLAPPEERAAKLEERLPETAGTHFPANVNQDLAAARRATAPFHNVRKAENAGYGQITDCVEHPTLGAQGIHYGKESLILDDEVEVDQPEVLMYEPQKNGKLRLVGVEYIIPFAFLPADSDPPELFGQHFHANEELELWALHVWVWRHNPSGLFADWNPKVTCRFAEE